MRRRKKEIMCYPYGKDIECKSVFGEFLRPFTFSSDTKQPAVLLPIVQPHQALPIGLPTVAPEGVKYNADTLIVPSGVYQISWAVNPSGSARVVLRVNGIDPKLVDKSRPGFEYPYTELVSDTKSVLDQTRFVNAKLPVNFIQLVNDGDTLFGLDNLPNTKIGNTGIITHIAIKRIGDVKW